ncbi:TetR/AcrR family transcriptional regulator [Aliarcobacter butzleri]|uniref:TetR/AcrR family transcriptional regulator n=1 Tax=Aliarcobacter butzleri TaxID=28197 RepID=UPI0009B7D48E|nr:TetR/AcrR family transcriptional regulator [Aliarcobacter butzleri]MDN5072464.1 TetR/AcrR family transcriptional regulator [Aliarcobacter butzleri]MDN5093469.1 TetR/AcrR family transcriptional regulator [Aliarcobacter butzleri]MDN5121318.1 TetR/AcrR family transcriptional regulator [Aliarcobacter butzleri]MDN5129914.1 TetR/AcrR family transcriptional regulator [Aliarcobacter butzleri]
MSSSKENKKNTIIENALKLFSQKGFYNTTIPDIAKSMQMSVGNMYNYFASKEELAKFAIKYSTNILADELRKINNLDISSKEKIYIFVKKYLENVQKSPEVIEYFLRVYLSNREVFKQGCEGFLCVGEFVTEVMILLDDGAQKKEFREQEFFPAFAMIMGCLGGFAFLSGENVLDKDILSYSDAVADNIYRALKYEE